MKTTTMIFIIATIIIIMTTMTTATAQTTTTIPLTPAVEPYIDEENGFRFQLPNGWATEEVPQEFSSDTVLNLIGEIVRPRVIICPEISAQPVIGGRSDCVQSSTVASGKYTMGI